MIIAQRAHSPWPAVHYNATLEENRVGGCLKMGDCGMATQKKKNNTHTFVRTYYVGLSILGKEFRLLDEKANEGKFI